MAFVIAPQPNPSVPGETRYAFDAPIFGSLGATNMNYLLNPAMAPLNQSLIAPTPLPGEVEIVIIDQAVAGIITL